jgi:hypothetical protein
MDIACSSEILKPTYNPTECKNPDYNLNYMMYILIQEMLPSVLSILLKINKSFHA